MSTVTKSTVFPAALEAEIYNKVRGKSSIAKMSANEPIPFTGKDIFTFNLSNKVSVLGESAQKPAGDAAITSVQIRPVKVVYQARFTNEFMYAAEEAKLQILKAFADGCSKALAEGLDEMVLHGVNPQAGTASSVIGNNNLDYVVANYDSAANKETWAAADSPVDKLEAVLSKIPEANGVIMGPTMRTAIAGLKGNGHQKAFPEFQFGGYPEVLGGSTLDVNRTVEANSSLDRAIVGNWDAFKWGYAKEMPIEIIEFGNPDGGAYDLKQNNEICLRTEMFVGWGFLDDSQFGEVVAEA